MDSLRDKLPYIGAGIAAIAVAGYLIYKASDKNTDDSPQEVAAKIPEAIKKQLPCQHLDSVVF